MNLLTAGCGEDNRHDPHDIWNSNDPGVLDNTQFLLAPYYIIFFPLLSAEFEGSNLINVYSSLTKIIQIPIHKLDFEGRGQENSGAFSFKNFFQRL